MTPDSSSETYGLIGSSAAMKEVREFIRKASQCDSTVLIYGETGTGKELVARAIHDHSSRKKKVFLPVHCGALAESVIESELFGHEKGAFTGADQTRQGKFEYTSGGTIFLDEINSAPPDVQVRLLRAIESKEITRVGGNEPIKVDVRVIAATNEDLKKAVAEGKFRPDLYYRLAVLTTTLPPLRDRENDIIELAEYFLQVYSEQNGKKFKGFTPEAMRKLREHCWPGNVRDLRNVIERAVVLAPLSPNGGLLNLPEFEPQPRVSEPEAERKEEIANIVYDLLLAREPVLKGLVRGSTELGGLAELLLEGIILGVDRYLESDSGLKEVLGIGYFLPRIGLGPRRPGKESAFNQKLRTRLKQLLQKHRLARKGRTKA